MKKQSSINHFVSQWRKTYWIQSFNYQLWIYTSCAYYKTPKPPFDLYWFFTYYRVEFFWWYIFYYFIINHLYESIEYNRIRKVWNIDKMACYILIIKIYCLPEVMLSEPFSHPSTIMDKLLFFWQLNRYVSYRVSTLWQVQLDLISKGKGSFQVQHEVNHICLELFLEETPYCLLLVVRHITIKKTCCLHLVNIYDLILINICIGSTLYLCLCIIQHLVLVN